MKACFNAVIRFFAIFTNSGKNDHFEALINPESLVVTYGVVEPGMTNSEPVISYQFEREGYFFVETTKT